MITARAKIVRNETGYGFAIPQEAAEALCINENTECTLRLADARSLLVEFKNSSSMLFELKKVLPG